jgi:hypothetical protein
MRKAIALRVNLWIEGEDAPAHDFADSTKQAVRDIIAAGVSTHPDLSVKIRGIVEANDTDENLIN